MSQGDNTMSVIDSKRQTPNRLVSPPDAQTADDSPTFRRPKIVLRVPTTALTLQKVQPGVPDTQLTRGATGLLQEFSSPLLFNHSHRVFLWANELGQQTGEQFDAELLFVCAAFHDLGLLKKFSSDDDRFEVDSANAVRLPRAPRRPADADSSGLGRNLSAHHSGHRSLQAA
jgi:hypothetical protein